MRYRFVALLLTLAFTEAQAQQLVTYSLSSGTGFVINNDGNVVTNNHVVKECRGISVLTPSGEQKATLVANDPEQDLAVLKTQYIPRHYASLRWNISALKVGDPVVLMGFPGRDGSRGLSQYRNSHVLGLKGPGGESRFIQLESVAAKGNSGGPVLDDSGNVIAVIAGVAMTFRADASGQPVGEKVAQADVAITLDALQEFLHQHGVSFYETASEGVGLSDAELREHAAHYILPVHCIGDVVRN